MPVIFMSTMPPMILGMHCVVKHYYPSGFKGFLKKVSIRTCRFLIGGFSQCCSSCFWCVVKNLQCLICYPTAKYLLQGGFGLIMLVPNGRMIIVINQPYSCFFLCFRL